MRAKVRLHDLINWKQTVKGTATWMKHASFSNVSSSLKLVLTDSI